MIRSKPQPATSTKPQTATSTKPQTATCTKPQTAASTKPQTAASTKPQTAASTKPQTAASTKPQTAASTKPQTATSTKPQTATSTKPQTAIYTKPQTVTSSRSDPTMQDTYIPTPPLDFKETALNLWDLLERYSLPRVIKCEKVPSSSKDALKCNLDIQQPLLAFMKRSVRKVSAHSLQLDAEETDFITVGNGILIPEDYPGWFAVMGVPNMVKQAHQKIPHYTSISYLATSGCSEFLIGGKDCVQGFLLQQDERGEGRPTHYQVPPGTALRRVGLYREHIPTATKEGKKKKKNDNVVPRKYLKCIDRENREIFLDVHQKGVFYVISKDGRPTVPAVCKMKDILKRFPLPLIVKLLYGRVPTTACAFTQVLLLTDSGLNHTLVASTLLCYCNINLEIPLGTDLKFYVAQKTDGLLASKAYVNALKSCEDKTSSYIKDMKVVFGNPQLDHEELTSISAKPSQDKKPNQGEIPPINKPVHRPIDIPVPSNGVPAPMQSPPVMRVSPTVNESVNRGIPKRPVSVFSETSYLSRMSQLITVTEGSFIITEPSSQSQSNKLPNVPQKDTIDALSKMELITMYEPPNPDKINDQITINQGQGHFLVNKRSTGIQVDLEDQTKVVYDNSPSACADHSELATSQPGFPSGSLRTNTEPNSDESNIYFQSWAEDRTSTITIPSKPGQPVSPARTPVTEKNGFDYFPMDKKIPPETASKPKGVCKTSNSLPLVPVTPQLYQRRTSERSSVSVSDSLVSMSQDDLCFSNWTSYDMNVDSLWPDTGYIPGDGQTFSQHQHIPSNNIILQSPPNDHIMTTFLAMRASKMDIKRNQYIDPIDEDYQKSSQPNEYDEASVITDHAYFQPIYIDNSTASGINEDKNVYTEYCHESQPIITNNSKDMFKSRGPPNTAPELPPRDNNKPRNLGEAVMKSIPAPSSYTFSQGNKHLLLLELRSAGITTPVELAFASLQWADITNLMSRDDDFDDLLVALLPKVGLIDLRKLAICLRGIKLRM